MGARRHPLTLSNYRCRTNCCNADVRTGGNTKVRFRQRDAPAGIFNSRLKEEKISTPEKEIPVDSCTDNKESLSNSEGKCSSVSMCVCVYIRTHTRACVDPLFNANVGCIQRHEKVKKTESHGSKAHVLTPYRE